MRGTASASFCRGRPGVPARVRLTATGREDRRSESWRTPWGRRGSGYRWTCGVPPSVWVWLNDLTGTIMKAFGAKRGCFANAEGAYNAICEAIKGYLGGNRWEWEVEDGKGKGGKRGMAGQPGGLGGFVGGRIYWLKRRRNSRTVGTRSHWFQSMVPTLVPSGVVTPDAGYGV